MYTWIPANPRNIRNQSLLGILAFDKLENTESKKLHDKFIQRKAKQSKSSNYRNPYVPQQKNIHKEKKFLNDSYNTRGIVK